MGNTEFEPCISLSGKDFEEKCFMHSHVFIINKVYLPTPPPPPPLFLFVLFRAAPVAYGSFQARV